MSRLARVLSRAGVGIEAPEVQVEIHLTGGLVKTTIIGLPETAVREAKDRVRSALINGRFEVPQSRVTISLAPAELPKEGSRFDLPIALGILAASRQIPQQSVHSCEFVGELSLSGELKSVRGILPVVLGAQRAGRTIVIPKANEAEAALVEGANIRCAQTLAEVVMWLLGQADLPAAMNSAAVAETGLPDLRDVMGQHAARRALEIAAAGNHNLLFIGPPGTGKTMLATRLPGILPGLSQQEALESAAVASISQGGFDPENWKQRPFRAPHHTASAVALVGGGARPTPGEISLAHNGVLFLDELPEFSRHVLEVLREPLESGTINISRAAGQASFPARFQLIASMNPCPCGHFGDKAVDCRCSSEQIQRYAHRVSGPLLDRIDMSVEVLRPKKIVIHSQTPDAEPSRVVRRRVSAAAKVQIRRQGRPNAHMDSGNLREHCALGQETESFMELAAGKLRLSPRGCQRVLRVARTIADLDGSSLIRQDHLAEAICLRQPAQGRSLA